MTSEPMYLKLILESEDGQLEQTILPFTPFAGCLVLRRKVVKLPDPPLAAWIVDEEATLSLARTMRGEQR